MVIEFTRWFLALFFISVAAFYILRILFVSRWLRRSPVFPGQPGSWHYATHLTFRIFRAAIFVVCVGRLFWPGLDQLLFPIKALWWPPVLVLGTLLLLMGFAWTLAVHLYMGRNWRSGVRSVDETILITTGPFALSRNPMMLGVLTGQVGLFLAMPTMFTLVCLIVGVWAVIVQVGIEERLLRNRFGATYDTYFARTARWLTLAPRMGDA